jgi:hypothetical protein
MALALDKATLEAALEGYRQRLEVIEDTMADLRRRLAGISGGEAKSSPPRAKAGAKTKKAPRGRRRLSAEGRARIIAAQKARWARSRKNGAS